MTQKQVRKDKQETKQAEPARQDETVPQGAEVTEGLSESIEDILDEIDEVLEANAEEFVKAYVQKGGE